MNDHQGRTPIKNWSEADKPREKMLLKGKDSLSDAELIAILIGSGNRNESAVELSRRILSSVSDNLTELSRLSVNDLMKFRGIGDAKAITIVAALELGKRRRSAEILQRKSIRSSKDAFECIYAQASDLGYEKFWIILLDQAQQIIRIVEISEGGITGTVADPKKIFRLVLESGATNLILCHNHPSGQLRPSQADVQLTEKIAAAARLLDISVLDHIIVGRDDYYSFADNGQIPTR
ncbi:MAG TPA: DNA repair protein RadC [Bacteroidales bacterium]|nr:DNA repair protein RadC [Bacteroidales bacterium]